MAKTGTMTHQEKMEKLAGEIRQLLLDHGMWIDTAIYFNGKRYDSLPVYQSESGEISEEYKSGWKNINYNNPNFLHVVEDVRPSEYMDYYNEDTITMSFEGDFYEIINYEGGELLEAFDELLRKYGYYYELGNAWNLALYEL